MKKTIAILALAAASANGQFINWNTQLDTAGNVLGSSQSGTQTFDISTDGSGCFLEVSWGVNGGTWNNGPGGASSINNLQDGGLGSNTITFTLTNATADFNILSQGTNTSAVGELGTLTSDAAIDYTIISGLSDLAGDNTTLVTYGVASGPDDRGQFSAAIAGATTFTYEYDTSNRNTGGVSTDAFQFGVSNITAANHVPEPSTALLGVLAGLGFIARRRRA